MQTGEEHAVRLSIGANSFAATIHMPGGDVLADVPHEDGSAQQGPDPYSFVLAGLGACTIMTVRMYAKRKGWPLEGAEIRLWHDHDYLADCEHCEESAAKLGVVRKVITLKGDLTEEQQKRLLQIAEQCPVNKTLKAGLQSVVELS